MTRDELLKLGVQVENMRGINLALRRERRAERKRCAEIVQNHMHGDAAYKSQYDIDTDEVLVQIVDEIEAQSDD